MIQESRRSVLVVDDQESWRDLLCELLEDEFEVKRAGNYLEARDVVLKQKPPFHVVVSDIRLTDDDSKNEDGLRLVEELNQLGDLTKIVVITGYPSIETAKRALGKLAVYDYLEKKPSDGRPFDPSEFRHIVRQAAEEAEQHRPDTIYLPHRALIIEPNPDLRKKIANLLRTDGYEVKENEDTNPLFDQSDSPSYDLLVVNESFLDDHLRAYRQQQMGIKIIVLTDKNPDLARKIHTFDALAAFPLHQEFDDAEFRQTVHKAFTAEMTKYVWAVIEGEPEPEFLHCSETYRLVLRISDVPQPNSIPIEIEPRITKGGLLVLNVSIYAPQVKFPSTETIWKIPAKGHIRPLVLEFIPQEAGKRTISLEIQSNSWMKAVSIEQQIRVK